MWKKNYQNMGFKSYQLMSWCLHGRSVSETVAKTLTDVWNCFSLEKEKKAGNWLETGWKGADFWSA